MYKDNSFVLEIMHQQLNFSEEILKLHRGPTMEELEQDKKERKQRAKERSERAREKLNSQEPQQRIMSTRRKGASLDETRLGKWRGWRLGLQFGRSIGRIRQVGTGIPYAGRLH